MHEESDKLNAPDNQPIRHPKRLSKLVKTVAVILLLLILVVGSCVGYVYAVSPAIIRHPQLEHYHFRLQFIIDGKSENFASKDFQTEYSKDLCTAALPVQPIHFHDNRDQFVHIHWEGITGGMVLKYYGWNLIGGSSDKLGYRLDDLKHIKSVPIHGSTLPNKPLGDNIFIFTGDKDSYAEKKFDDFTKQDLEVFFNKTSNFPAHQLNKRTTSWLQAIEPKAYAHGADAQTTTDIVNVKTTDEEELKRINNLIGNAVIFVQKSKPSDAQIKERFNQLAPLPDSSCGG